MGLAQAKIDRGASAERRKNERHKCLGREESGETRARGESGERETLRETGEIRLDGIGSGSRTEYDERYEI